MTVKEIITLSATMIGEDDVALFAKEDGPSDNAVASKNYNIFLNCYNIVTDELATEYYPLKTFDKKTLTDGKIMPSTLSKKPLKINGVTDKKGNKLAYRLINGYIDVGKVGDVVVYYDYIPGFLSDSDEAEYSNNIIGPYILCYGIISEYLLNKGNISESDIWHNKYMNGLRGKIAERRNLKIPSRRW